MKSTLIICIVFAALVRNSCAQQQSTVYGLSEEQSTQLNGVIENQKTNILESDGAIAPVFDILEVLSSTRKVNVQGGCVDYATYVTKALDKAKASSRLLYNSIAVVRGGSSNCADAETSRVAAFVDLDNTYAAIANAIGLVLSENYTDIRTQLEPFQVAAVASLETCMQRLFTTLRTCANVTDATTLAAFEIHENESTRDIGKVIVAIFDAIKVFSSGNSNSISAEDIVDEINRYRQRASSMLESSMEHIFGLIQGFYLSTQLNLPESVASLITDQYVHSVSDNRYKAAVEILFDVFKGYLTRVQLGLSEGCHGDSSAIGDLQAQTVKYFKAGFIPVTNLHPTTAGRDTSIAATAASRSKSIDQFVDQATDGYYKGIKLALGQQGSSYSETVRKIQAVKEAVQVLFPGVVRTAFSVLQLGINAEVGINLGANINLGVGISIGAGINVGAGASIGAGITPLQDKSIIAGQRYVDNVFNSIQVVAKACHGVKAVTQEDFITLQNAQNDVDNLLRNFTLDISTGHVSVLKGLNQSPARTTSAPSFATPNLLNLGPIFTHD